MRLIRKTLAVRLSALMHDKGIKQTATRDLTGVAQKTISNILNSSTAASVDTLEAIANGFKVEPWTLLVKNINTIEEATEASHLLRLYLSANHVGRSQIIRTAEAEVRYSTKEDLA